MSKSVKGRSLALGLALVVVLALIAILAFGLVQAGNRGAPVERQGGLELASDISLPLLSGEGHFRLSDLRGKKAVVLNFWFPSCPPCRAEAPALETLWKQYQNDVELVGVFVPNPVDNEQTALNFLREFGVTYPNITDVKGEAALEYGINGFPTTVFITKEGRVKNRWVGYLDSNRMWTFTSQLVGG